jgi:hypothetical protein
MSISLVARHRCEAERDGLSTSAVRDPSFMDNFKKPSKQIERLAATLILTPFPRRLAHSLRVHVVKCVGEDNVIDPLQRRLKQKRSQVYKLVIFFMNRETEVNLAKVLSQAYFRDRSKVLV